MNHIGRQRKSPMMIHYSGVTGRCCSVAMGMKTLPADIVSCWFAAVMQLGAPKLDLLGMAIKLDD